MKYVTENQVNSNIFGTVSENSLEKGGQNTDNISRNNKKDNFAPPLMEELEGYEKQNIALFLNGRPSSPWAIANACNVAEAGGYMRDYTEDENGRIAQVNFEFVEDV